MRSKIVKHSIVIRGKKTSVSMEKAFWTVFKNIASEKDTTIGAIAGEIDLARRDPASPQFNGNLSSAIRLYVLDELCECLEKISRPHAIGFSPPMQPAA